MIGMYVCFLYLCIAAIKMVGSITKKIGEKDSGSFSPFYFGLNRYSVLRPICASGIMAVKSLFQVPAPNRPDQRNLCRHYC